MISKTLLVVYYSGTGRTKRMAEEIVRGAERLGVNVNVMKVEECGPDDLSRVDGLAVGSPTYFSNVAWQVKKLIDDSIVLYNKGHQLEEKVGGFFTSSGSQRDGKDCIKMLELAFRLHHRMKTIPGIVVTKGDREDRVSKICQEYGMRIAKQMLS